MKVMTDVRKALAVGKRHTKELAAGAAGLALTAPVWAAGDFDTSTVEAKLAAVLVAIGVIGAAVAVAVVVKRGWKMLMGAI